MEENVTYVDKYGDTYSVIKTEIAKRAIEENISIDEASDPDSTGDSEVAWWRVCTFNEHESLWMNNFEGQIIILTDRPQSYYRCF